MQTIYVTRYKEDDPRKMPLEPSKRSGFISLDMVVGAMGDGFVSRSRNMVIYNDGHGVRLCFSTVVFSSCQ